MIISLVPFRAPPNTPYNESLENHEHIPELQLPESSWDNRVTSGQAASINEAMKGVFEKTIYNPDFSQQFQERVLIRTLESYRDPFVAAVSDYQESNKVLTRIQTQAVSLLEEIEAQKSQLAHIDSYLEHKMMNTQYVPNIPIGIQDENTAREIAPYIRKREALYDQIPELTRQVVALQQNAQEEKPKFSREEIITRFVSELQASASFNYTKANEFLNHIADL
jgi:hypothetical protein